MNPPKKVIVMMIMMSVPAFLNAVTTSATDYDPYGGWRTVHGTKTGFFHTEKINGKWWIISPEGNGFLSKGVNSVHPPHLPTFQEEGLKGAVTLLKSSGMNTAGCWSDPNLMSEGIPFTYRSKIVRTPEKEFPDVFDLNWKNEVEQQALSSCSPYRTNPWLLGYFIDNERPWKHEDQAEEFLQLFLKLPSSSPGYQEAMKAKAAGINEVVLFREKVAERYFTTIAEAVRHADPNHMILGCRFAGRPPLGVVAKMKGHSDVISINNYSERPPLPLLEAMSRVAELPVIVSEFSFKGPAEGLDHNGSGPEKSTQVERAMGFRKYAEELLRQNYCVGYHWFKYGENWQGILQADGHPFPELIQAFTAVNASAEIMH